MTFLKNDPRPCATLKQVCLDRFELVVAHFGPPKIPKCLENGLFWDQKWVKNGSKTHFSKPHPRPFGVHKRVKAHFQPILGHFGLESGSRGDGVHLQANSTLSRAINV